MSRGEIMGKTPRELFPAAAAELIEKRDRQLLERKQQLEVIVDTVDNPVRGRSTMRSGAFRSAVRTVNPTCSSA